MWKKISIIGSGFLLAIALVTSGFVIEDRYNNQTHHDKDIQHEREVTKLELAGFEKQIVTTLQQFQKSSDYKYYSQILENLNEQMYKLRQWLREHPNDQDAREDYENIKTKIDMIKQKLNSLMESN